MTGACFCRISQHERTERVEDIEDDIERMDFI